MLAPRRNPTPDLIGTTMMLPEASAVMVRNSADHGLETAEERRAVGKPEHGLIRLSAYHEGGYIIIRIADDGRGLDSGRIKAKAIAQGLVSEVDAEKLPENQIHKFIFAPGFSTAAKVTNVSGRGVGMDVVRNNIDQIGGTIDVKSVAGAGLSFTIKIPLTLAIVAALIVEAGGHRFAIPQLSVVELVRARSGSEHRIESIKNTRVLRLRDKLLPLISLRQLFGLDSDAGEINGGFIVVTQVGSQTFGIVVDGVFHTEEIVVKPMSSKLRHIPMFSGNTILGDGSVIMLDRVGAGLSNTRADRDNVMESLLGVSDTQRQLAVDLDVDPYTDFPPLAERLKQMAGAMAGGGLPVRAGLALVPGGVGIAVSSVASVDTAKDSLRNKTAAQVIAEAKSTLASLAIPPETIDRLVENRNYTPADLLIMHFLASQFQVPSN